ATAGPREGSLGAPYWAPRPRRAFLEEVGADPGRLRIAFSAVAPTGVDLHPDCVTAVREAAALCEALGHHVSEAAPAIDGPAWAEAFTTLWAVRCAANVAGWAGRAGRIPLADQFEPGT